MLLFGEFVDSRKVKLDEKLTEHYRPYVLRQLCRHQTAVVKDAASVHRNKERIRSRG